MSNPTPPPLAELPSILELRRLLSRALCDDSTTSAEDAEQQKAIDELLDYVPSLLTAAERVEQAEAKCARVGVCDECDGTGAGEPDYAEHVAVPTACPKCMGGGCEAFFQGQRNRDGYFASCLGTPKGADVAEHACQVRRDRDTAIARAEHAEREREEMGAVVEAAEAVLVDAGPECFACGFPLAFDLDTCTPGCRGHELRKAVVALAARRSR